jgi:hypothetical protein
MVFLFRIILCFPCSFLSGPETINTSLNPLPKQSLPEQCSNSRYICQTWRGDDLFEIDSVLLVQLLEDFNLPNGRDRELAPNLKEMRAVNQYVFQNASRGIPTPSRSLSMRIFLTATIYFVSVSFAMNNKKRRHSGGAQLGQCAGGVLAGLGKSGEFREMRTRRCPPRSAVDAAAPGAAGTPTSTGASS